jgi:hypothetical protein
MVRTFDLKNALLGVSYDIKAKCESDEDDLQILSMALKRLRRISDDHKMVVEQNMLRNKKAVKITEKNVNNKQRYGKNKLCIKKQVKNEITYLC